LAVLDQFRPQAAHGVHLVWVVLGRHDQNATNPETAAGISQRLAVIAGRATDDAAFFLLVRKARYEVDAAANLESCGWRVILVLEEVTAPQHLRQCRPLVQRRRLHVCPHDGRGGDDVGVGWWFHVPSLNRLALVLAAP